MDSQMLSVIWNIGINAGAWLLLHLLVTAVHARLPDRWFAVTGFPASKKEQLFYTNGLKIKAWKKRLPDGGGWSKQGFRKKRIEERSEGYLERYQLEAHRGEWCHLISMLPAPLFFLWNTPMVGMMMVLYALAANLPCIFALRYNRARILHLLDRRAAPIASDSVVQIDPGTR